MDGLINTFRIKLSLTPMGYIRSFHDRINWNSRLICIMGQKGVGKSTLMLQHIKKYNELGETLFVSADNMHFAGHTLYELAGKFFLQGGKHLYIDEIHKYKGWSIEIKNIYDDYPTLQVVYSGSCLLALKKGNKADLSSRSLTYEMPGLSFREFLNIRNGWDLKSSTLDEVLQGKVDFPYGENRPLKYYKESGLFNALREPGHSDNLLAKIEKLYLGNSNIAFSLSENGIIDDGNMRETNFLAWTSQVFNPTQSKISDFEIDGVTFEVGGKNKKGSQIKDAQKGYLVKDNLEYASGRSIPIWMFGFLY